MRSDSMPRAVVTCTVISHQPFGLLVELENKEKGMIRIRETSWDANERARWKQHFPPGARLKALIIKQQEGRYVELSARLAEDDPWERIGENFHEGQVVNGTVTGVKHYGAFVEIRPGLTGLLHRSRLPAWCKTNVLDLFWPGDMVKVQILKIDHKQKQISLASAPVTYSDKNAAPLPALRTEQPGDRVMPFDLLVRQETRRYVVVVEDDAEQGKGVVNYLENLGQRVSLAGSAEEGLELLERELPDLALVDINLPGMNGIAMIKSARERWPSLQCVLSTSWGYLEQHIAEVEQLKETGVMVLLKPLMPDDLLDLLLSLESGALEETDRRPDLAASTLPDVDRSSFQAGLRKLLQRCLEITEFDLGVLFRLDPVHRRVDILHQAGELPGANAYLDDLIFSPVRDVAEDGDQVVIEDVSSGNYDARFRYLMQSYPFSACLGVRVPNKLVQDYALFLFDQQAREIYHEEVAFAQATALAVGSLLERKMLTDQLRASQKMTMLGHLSSYLSHELNHGLSPLSNSIKNLQLDLEGLAAHAKQNPDRFEQELAYAQEHLRDVRKSVINLTETIRAFRDLLSVGKKQIVNMGELVQDTLTLLRQTSAVSRVNLVFEAGENLVAIRSQMPLLQHVLLNLVMNSIEQIAEIRPREGGQVLIRVERIDRAGGPPVIRISVADNGPGIHRRLWEKIFEAGFTTRPDGSGLGLYISRNIVESLGGRLYVAESYVNSGTVFAVDFPYQI